MGTVNKYIQTQQKERIKCARLETGNFSRPTNAEKFALRQASLNHEPVGHYTNPSKSELLKFELKN